MKQENTNSAELILLTGDLHIPYRVLDIPEEIKKVFQQKTNKFNHILCTGNVSNSIQSTKEIYDWLKSLCANQNNFHCVKSENSFGGDEKFEETKTVKVGDFNITLINGYQVVPWGDVNALASVQKQTGCDILVSGYTHQPGVFYNEGKYYLNPGSLTGAYSPLVNDPNPSFMILAISGDCGIIYHYELNVITKNFEINKVDINKNKSE